MNFAGKHIAVLGLARSGESVAHLLVSKGAHVTVYDSGLSETLRLRAEKLRKNDITVFLGNDAVVSKSYDAAVISPGIDLASAFARQFSDLAIPLTGELEVASMFCQKPIIAITGTNGKTTTTELISAMLNSVGRPTIACGNIGLPLSEVVGQQQELLDYAAVEVSSFQLETINTFRPTIALWLNFTADHLDRYDSMEDYRTAKLRLFENQTNRDWAICNAADDLPELAAQKIKFSAYGDLADFTIVDEAIAHLGNPIARLDTFRIHGRHNVENLMAALAVGKILDIPFASLLPALQNYTPAPHRCEVVAVQDGVHYINDSKSTNIDAMVRALNSVSGKSILIAGGKNKGFAFGSIVKSVAEKVSHAILIGEMAESIYHDWSPYVPCHLAPTLSEAVYQAQMLAQAGDTVLFSPGTSSFDMFRDYADRGEHFRAAVKNLSNPKSMHI